ELGGLLRVGLSPPRAGERVEPVGLALLVEGEGEEAELAGRVLVLAAREGGEAAREGAAPDLGPASGAVLSGRRGEVLVLLRALRGEERGHGADAGADGLLLLVGRRAGVVLALDGLLDLARRRPGPGTQLAEARRQERRAAHVEEGEPGERGDGAEE